MRTAPRSWSWVLAVSAGIAALGGSCLVGCRRAAERAQEKAEEKAIEQQTGGQVSINGQKGTMTIVNDAGTVTMGVGASIPDDFPKAIPIYPGAKADLAAKQSNPQGKPAWSLTLESPDPKDKVVAFYKANLSAFKMASDMNMGETDMSVWQNAQYDVTLMVSDSGDKKTAITISAAGK